MNEKGLFNYWKKYVDSTYLYRVVSEEYLSDIKKNGFDHKDDPFDRYKKDIFRLFDICLKLYKKGFIMMRWWGRPVDQAHVIKCTANDLNKPFIDFTPNFGSAIKEYLRLKGGALVNTVLIFTEELLMKKPPLTSSEIKLIKKLNNWSRKKFSYNNKVVVIRASSKSFETAQFQYFWGDNVESPFGSFEHFKKVVSKKGLDFYTPYLTGKKLFFLRTTTFIPASQIYKISNTV